MRKVLKALKLPAKEALRTKEDEFKELKINLENDEEVIKAIMKVPKLLQRPIVMKGDSAVIARPPEKVLELF
ncbi:MAG: ArsC/Spx/MgsR family protein [Bacteriovoracaceae bacterium]